MPASSRSRRGAGRPTGQSEAGRGGARRGEAKRGARIYSAKSKPQRDRSHQVTNYFEFSSIKSKVACRPSEHESTRLIEHRTYLELSRSAEKAGERCLPVSAPKRRRGCEMEGNERQREEEKGEQCRFGGHLKIDRNLFATGGYRGSGRNASPRCEEKGKGSRFFVRVRRSRTCSSFSLDRSRASPCAASDAVAAASMCRVCVERSALRARVLRPLVEQFYEQTKTPVSE